MKRARETPGVNVQISMGNSRDSAFECHVFSNKVCQKSERHSHHTHEHGLTQSFGHDIDDIWMK